VNADALHRIAESFAAITTAVTDIYEGAALSKPEPRRLILDEISAERLRQTALWGDQSGLPDGTSEWNRSFAEYCRVECESATKDGSLTFTHILLEEFWEVLAETDPAKLRAELVQLAAVAVQWVEAIDSRSSDEPDDEPDDDEACLTNCLCGHRSMDHYGGGVCLPDSAFSCPCKVYLAPGGQP
jgi:hypothetical protein